MSATRGPRHPLGAVAIVAAFGIVLTVFSTVGVANVDPERLPIITGLGGLLLTALAAFVARQLVRGRSAAESNTAEQSALFLRLQRALLPQVNPVIPQIEIASRYEAGARGVDIGGDWYSVIRVDRERFAFVVGDVSGHGVDAVAVMAHARFTLRAYLFDGDSPDVALQKCSRQFDITVDDHLITAVVGIGNWRTGQFVVANAGHPPLLLATAGQTEFISIPAGPPLGIGPSSYKAATLTLVGGSTLIAYTDGLIERRTEGIDAGLQRLVDVVEPIAHEPVEDLVTQTLASMRDDDAADDIAVLALRRQDALKITLDADVNAPGKARAAVAAHLVANRLSPGALADKAVLIASELVTNAVQAGAAGIEVDLRVASGRLDLVVTDDADGWPAPTRASVDDIAGRGLSIVEHLADSWGVERRRRGKAITASWFDGSVLRAGSDW